MDTHVFHGTSNGEIDEFEPRQSMSHGKKDGKPGISASEYLAPAIFMAIFSRRVSCGWDATENSFGFYLNKQDYELAKKENWRGFVYTFSRTAFKKRAGWEWRAYDRVKPLQKFEVTFADLPKDIDLR